MKILLTNLQLDHRTGTEIVIRDLALGLQRRGHEPVVYAPRYGPPVADELQAHDIAVVDRIEDAPFTPDVIHGHHHSPTMEALDRFAGVPAIWVCHGRYFHEDIPPQHPNIRLYVAVDLNCRERLVAEAGIPEQRVRLIHNAVDLNRFPRRDVSTIIPSHAAVFSSYAGSGGFLEIVARAADQAGIPLDVIGERSGFATDDPGSLLGRYDVVFAKARCALEALTVGCAVILLDYAGMGPMVSTRNVHIMRDWNFGARCLQAYPTPELLLGQLALFDRGDADLVTDWIRSVVDVESCLDTYVDLYREAVEAGPIVRSSDRSPLARALEYTILLEDRLRLLQAPLVTLPLPPTIGGRVELKASGDQTWVRPQAQFGFDVTIRNRSAETLATVSPHPVNLGYHWIPPEGVNLQTLEGERTPLPRAIHPGSSETVRMTVTAPPVPGAYGLRISLVQELVFWFEDLVPPSACWLTIEVTEQAGAGGESPTMTLRGLVATCPASQTLGLRLHNDGQFSDLGFVDDNGEAKLVFALSANFVRRAGANKAVSCVVTTEALTGLVPDHVGVVSAPDPRMAFFTLHNWLVDHTAFFADRRDTTIAQSAIVHPSAVVDPHSVSIGEGCIVGPHVVIDGPAHIGAGTRIDAGAVIGASAFQTSDRASSYLELRHAGGVRIGSNSHVYSNATIARGVFRADTRIGNRCQIGNNAFISHQCDIDDHVFIGHGATLNGRARIGPGAWIGPGAILSNGVSVGEDAHVALGSTVIRDVPAGGRVSGLPALEQHSMFRLATGVKTKRFAD